MVILWQPCKRATVPMTKVVKFKSTCYDHLYSFNVDMFGNFSRSSNSLIVFVVLLGVVFILEQADRYSMLLARICCQIDDFIHRIFLLER